MELPVVVVVVDPPETREGGEALMSGCGGHSWAACLDLNMLGQFRLLKDAMLAFLLLLVPSSATAPFCACQDDDGVALGILLPGRRCAILRTN